MTVRVSVLYQRDITHFVFVFVFTLKMTTAQVVVMSVTLNNSLLRIMITRTIIFHLLMKTLSVGLSMVIGPENVPSVTQRSTN